MVVRVVIQMVQVIQVVGMSQMNVWLVQDVVGEVFDVVRMQHGRRMVRVGCRRGRGRRRRRGRCVLLV